MLFVFMLFQNVSQETRWNSQGKYFSLPSQITEPSKPERFGDVKYYAAFWMEMKNEFRLPRGCVVMLCDARKQIVSEDLKANLKGKISEIYLLFLQVRQVRRLGDCELEHYWETWCWLQNARESNVFLCRRFPRKINGCFCDKYSVYFGTFEQLDL